MKTVDEVLALLDREVHPLSRERVSLEHAPGRILGEDIVADADLPAFSKSSIDGYALAADAPAGTYAIVGEVKPGFPAAVAPKAGEALKVYTGSALAEAGVGLVMVEDATLDGTKLTTRASADARLIRPRGSQMEKGEIVLRAGMPVLPAAVTLMATVGAATPLVSRRPRAVHLVTGTEIVPVETEPGPGQIRDSNSWLIRALLADAGAEHGGLFHATESVEEGMAALTNTDADLILISGGASVGAYDGSAEILRRLGFTIHSDKMNLRPGKPMVLATHGAQVAFALPGNPLSHFVCFHLFVRRAIDLLMGRPPLQRVLVGLDGPPPTPNPRETWWPAIVRADGGMLAALPLPWVDSSDLSGIPLANALLRVNAAPTNGLVEALIFGSLYS
jgi:molybdopterin molybdotransferase